MKRVYFVVFPFFSSGLGFESRISISLSDEVSDELEKNSIVKRSA